MKRIKTIQKFEAGQVIPIVVIAVIIMIGLAALILDGGALLLNRRSAQNVADSAAIAGARVYCGEADATEAEVYAAIDEYILYNNTELGNIATLIERDITDENVGNAADDIQNLIKGEVVVTVEVEHGSFFAPIFKLANFGAKTEAEKAQLDVLTAQATAAAGCFNNSPDVVLPIAFPCQLPVRDSVEGISEASDDCDYVMLDWDYFDSVATGVCGMSVNPLAEGVTPTAEQAACISNYLATNHSDMIYVIMNEEKFCAKDPTNVDTDKEIVCNLFGDSASQINTSERGWLNLSDGNAGQLDQWVTGDNTVENLHEHVWLSFLGGTRAKPTFNALETRLFQIVYIPVFNYVCDDKPYISNVPGTCWYDAHYGWTDEEGVSHPGIADSEGVCELIDGNPGNDYAHVIAFAPFFTTCIRNGSKDLKNFTKDYGYDPTVVENFDELMDCPGFAMAASIEVSGAYPNMVALDKNNYSFEGFFINPGYLQNPENMSQGGADIGVYTVFLTR